MRLMAFAMCSRLFQSRSGALNAVSSTLTSSPCCARRYAVVAKSNQRNQYVLAESQLDRVEAIVQYKFSNRALLAEALTHRSVVNASSSKKAFFEQAGNKNQIHRNNERLELLGDRVFGLVAVQALYNRDPNTPEGQLSSISQTMVSRKSAREHSHALGLKNFLLENDCLRGKEGSRYGDSFEALLGALFLDGGYEAAYNFYVSRIMPMWDNRLRYTPGNACQKRFLQEYLVQQGLPSPSVGTQISYITTHFDQEDKMFTRAIRLFGRLVSEAKGVTVQSADQAAALLLLTRLKGLPEGRSTCFLIRLARQAEDQYSLAKLQQTRSTQIATGTEGLECARNVEPKVA